MIVEPWLLLHAAKLVEEATSHIIALAGTVEHQAHSFLEEIKAAVDPSDNHGFINGGCHPDGDGG